MEKKDYTNSGVNLCNPPEVKLLIDHLHACKVALADINASIADAVPEGLRNAQAKWQKDIAETTAELRLEVEAYGGYQDIESETYALFQTRRTAQYDALMLAGGPYEKIVPMVIEETVNVNALKGLIKGGIVSQEDLERHNVITYKESQAFILSLPSE